MTTTENVRLTTAGSVVAFCLALALGLSPFILVFAPIVPLVAVIYVTVRRQELGTAWMGLYIAAWIVLLLSFWPYLGLSVS